MRTPGRWEARRTCIVAPECPDEYTGEPTVVVDCSGAMNGQDTDADKRLMALAPELLEFASEAREFLRAVDEPRSVILPALLRRADELLARAEGRT